MNFFLKTPCNNCPFRRDVKFCLHPERRQEIADALRHDMTFSCHKTVDYSDEWNDSSTHIPTEDEQHCAGALIVLNRSGELFNNFLYRLAVWAKLFDPDKLNMHAPVFDTLDQFVEADDG